MASIDIAAEIDVAGDPTDVAAVLFDPQRASEWMQAVTRVEILDPALAPGARVTHHGRIMGHDLTWTTEVRTVHFPHLLVLQLTDGPVSGTVRYDVQRAGTGTRARVRYEGEPDARLSFVPASMIAGALRGALVEDLQRLKTLVEG